MPLAGHMNGSIGPFRRPVGGRYTRRHPLRMSNEPELNEPELNEPELARIGSSHLEDKNLELPHQ